jgi:hypothetical protein
MFGKLAKIAAWASLGFIVYATLVPPGMRPTLGDIGANYERFAAYAVASVLLVLAYPRYPVRVGILVIASALRGRQRHHRHRDHPVDDAVRRR